MRHTRGKKSDFTLVELLLVIAIIAILASLLLPAMSKIKQKGHSIACLGNLKQIGSLLQMYADDFGGNLPKNNCLREDGGMQRWDDSLDSLYPGGRKIFVCPVSGERHEKIFSALGQWSDCYIPNGRSLKLYWYAGDTSCTKTNQILKPSFNIFLLDRKVGVVKDLSSNNAGWPFLDDQLEANGRIGYYHSFGKGVNIVWADGHSSWKEGGSILPSNFSLDGN